MQGGRPARDLVGIVSTATMAAVAWLTVLSGAWIVYPGYRAEPPSQGADLSKYPEAVLTSDPQLSFWHTFGMKWKEHIGWVTPFLATAVAFVMWRHGGTVVAALMAAGVGCAALGLCVVLAAASASFETLMDLYAPAGP